jgi:hypothetical protein
MENLVTVITYSEPTEMLIPKSLLESEGIECFVIDEMMSRLYPTGAVGGIKLQVREQVAEQAVKILIDGGFLKEEELKPSGLYEFVGRILKKIGKK